MREAEQRPAQTSLTLMHMLAHAEDRHPAGEALVVVGGVRLTYAELFASVTAFSAGLRDNGITGGRVAVALPNSADLIIAVLGTMAAGCQVVLLNPSYTAREIEPILSDADPSLIVCSAAQPPAYRDVLAKVTGSDPLLLAPPFETLIRRGATARNVAFLLPQPDDLAILQYTGGTTGRSKGVNLTHRTTALNVVQREHMLPTRWMQERFLCMTPLFHSYATATSFFPTIYSAGTLVAMPRYDAERALDLIAEERITLFCGAPTIYNGVTAHPGFAQKNYSTLIGAYSGAAPLSLATLAAWESVTGVPIAEGYGLTEATAVLCFNPLFGRRKPGSVGLPLPGTTVEIVDPDDQSTVLGSGRLGEIRARGPQLMAGYRGSAADTASILRDGWLYTGDIGEIDADGYVFVRDRKKDMAIVGGYNVYPREIDEVLASHPAVVDAVAAGVPDAYRGEIIKACVTLRKGEGCDERALLDHCRQNLAPYKVPARIFVVQDVRKTAAGKIDRKGTRDWLLGQAAEVSPAATAIQT